MSYVDYLDPVRIEAGQRLEERDWFADLAGRIEREMNAMEKGDPRFRPHRNLWLRIRDRIDEIDEALAPLTQHELAERVGEEAADAAREESALTPEILDEHLDSFLGEEN